MRTILTACLMAGLLLSAAACNDTFIDPFENDDRFYTIYGFIDQTKNFEQGAEHTVRVIPVTRFPERIESPADGQASIDATVTSTDLRTGQTTRWRHSLEQLDDGTYGHIFRASFLVQPGRPYRLTVTRSDGVTATAETQVPFITDAARFVTDPVVVTPDSVVTQEVFMPGIPSPWRIEAIYLMNNQSSGRGGLQSRHYVSYGRAGERTADDGWRVRLHISEDQPQVREEVEEFRRIGAIDSTALTLVSMGVRIRILDEKWDPPEGVFDPEVLAQPGTLSNVENGYGFWGSVGVYTQEWPVTIDFSRLLGYKG